MKVFTCMILTVLALAVVDCRELRISRPSLELSTTSGRSHLAEQESSAGRHIVSFKSDTGNLVVATQRLVDQLAAASRTRTKTVAATTPVPEIEVYNLDGSSIFSSDSHHVSALGAASSASYSSGIQSIVVTGVTADALAAIKAADSVAHVIPDLPTAAAVGCTSALALAQGLESSLAQPSDVWPGIKRCIPANTKLIWVGERCGDDFSSIHYKAIYAMDALTNTVRSFSGKDCVLLPRESNSKFNKDRFGSCGVAPALAADLPTTICPSDSSTCLTPRASSATSSASIKQKVTLRAPVACGTKRTTRLTYTGMRCGPQQQYIAWVSATGPGGCSLVASGNSFKFVHDTFGSCGVQPSAALQAVSMTVCDRTGTVPSPTPSPVQSPVTASPDVSPSPLVSPSPEIVSPSPVPTPSASPPAGSDSNNSSGSDPTGPSRDPDPLQKTPVAAGETVPSGLKIIEAVTAAGINNPAQVPAGQQVVVGVMDTGVDSTHPDISYVGGRNFLDSVSPAQDKYGHGTHVAGIVGARNNGKGIVGVSPGAGIYSLRVLDDTGNGVLSATLAAIKWVATEGVKQGIRVVNLSQVTYMDPSNVNYAGVREVVCQYYKEASDAGVIIAAAAGNKGQSIAAYFPAICPDVLAVAAVDATGKAAATTYSNWASTADAGAVAHTIAAPGTSIYSTVPTSVDPSGYYTLTGTSMAAPHVAGVAANCFMSGSCATNQTGTQNSGVILAAAKARLAMGNPVVKYNAQATVPSGKWFGNLLYSMF